MSEWSDDRVALLKKLWTEGYSASQIAKQIGATTRNAVIGKIHRLGLNNVRQSAKMTPPSTIGTSLSPQLSPSAKAKNISAKVPAKTRHDYTTPAEGFARVAATPAAAEFELPEKSINYAARSAFAGTGLSGLAARVGMNGGASTAHNPYKTASRTCQWPVGDPRSPGFHFCGAECVEGMSYCAEHARLAYQPTAKKRVNLGNADLHNGGTPDDREINVRV